jgi:hypothetical protein
MDYLAEVYRLLGKNESEIARLTRELEELAELLKQGEALRDRDRHPRPTRK